MSLLYNLRRAIYVLRREGWNGLQQAGQRFLLQKNRVGLWDRYGEEARLLVNRFNFSQDELLESQKLQQSYPGNLEINSISWFIPSFSHPHFGGIYTILRFAQYLRQHEGIQNQFVMLGGQTKSQFAAMISKNFPGLSDSNFHRINTYEDLYRIETTDASVATLWNTAYYLLKFRNTKRKFYFIQDYEPLFFPAGAIYAQVEATYRFGFYGIANTPSIKQIYTDQYGGLAEHFYPCIDKEIFFPAEPKNEPISEPLTVFFYGRPKHPRNGFELGVAALTKLKEQLGDSVRIVSAGAEWQPHELGLENIVENLGLLQYQETADLYRSCDVGLVMMFTRHPSYLPLELMASGCLVVTNYNPATIWLLKDRENCLLTEPSVTCLTDTLMQGLRETELRKIITLQARSDIQNHYQDWDSQIQKIYAYMRNPLERAK